MDLKADPKRVVSEGETYLARAVIIATGSRYRDLDIPGEKRLSGHGVSWCATCDGFFFREQEIAVVGGGDSAMEEALFLTRFASTVTVIHRRDQLRASKIMQERAFANPKIKFRCTFAIAAVVVGREARRLDSVAPRSVYIVDEAVEFVAEYLPPDTQGRLTPDELEQLLTFHMRWLHAKGLQPANVDRSPPGHHHACRRHRRHADGLPAR